MSGQPLYIPIDSRPAATSAFSDPVAGLLRARPPGSDSRCWSRTSDVAKTRIPQTIMAVTDRGTCGGTCMALATAPALWPIGCRALAQNPRGERLSFATLAVTSPIRSHVRRQREASTRNPDDGAPGVMSGSPTGGRPSAMRSKAVLAVSSLARTYRMNVCGECPMILAPVLASPPIKGASAVAKEWRNTCGVRNVARRDVHVRSVQPDAPDARQRLAVLRNGDAHSLFACQLSPTSCRQPSASADRPERAVSDLSHSAPSLPATASRATADLVLLAVAI